MKRFSTVAIIGKPNSGKSTLFNRITRSRKAITHKTPGVTRDRMEEIASWNGVEFRVIDTGGFSLSGEDPLQGQITARIERTVAESAVVVFLVDVDTGVTTEDENLLKAFRKEREKIILAVNKVESNQDRLDANEFYSMGFNDVHFISSVHGQGIGDLLDEIVTRLPKKPQPQIVKTDLRISIVGKPNVGKSSLLNSLIGDDRHIVSEEPGTTRDTINIKLRYHDKEIILIDTAGIKRKSRTERGLDSISSLKSLQSVKDSDIVLIMLDASRNDISRQDTRIAAAAHKERKGSVLLLNKWDLLEKDNRTLGQYISKVKDAMPFLSYAPILTISALEGTRLSRIFPLCLNIQEERRKRISTSELNRCLEEALSKTPPSFYKTGTGKVYYGTQTGIEPPTFTLFVNKSTYFPRSYIRYLNNHIRNTFTFEGTAIKITLKSKE
ncbi:MAG: ribosome biogenesis GTPase Der [Candidatus Krumholzibacteriota bacterium]|nr:ribosome biogenesis GTPase Der [Candidatus Krumholzibacteriota bacterium]